MQENIAGIRPMIGAQSVVYDEKLTAAITPTFDKQLNIVFFLF